MTENKNECEMDFVDIYTEFRDKIRRHLARFVGEHEAEDLAQEVFLKAISALHTFEGRAQVSTWLFRIATNAAIDRLRSKSGRTEVDVKDFDWTIEEEAEWAAERAASPEREAIQKEMNDCILDIVGTLPENYRIALQLGELEGFSNREIAEITGTSLETVKIRLHRARRELKKRLSLACDFHRNEQNEFACDRKNSLLKFR